MPIEPKIFKAYDVRGKYPEELNEETAFQIAAAVGKHFGGRAKIIVGRDGRLSSPTLYKAVTSGLKVKSYKLKVISVGIMTTPTLYFLVNKLKADGGIMVTASHNPKNYNGLKVVGKNARPISGKEILKLVSASPAFLSAPASLRSSGGARLRLAAKTRLRRDQSFGGSVVAVRNAGKSDISLYSYFLKKFLKPKRKLKVVFDCSNGTTGRILRQLTTNNKQLTTIFINDNPDGNFPAHGPNPLLKGATGQLEKEVKKQKADLGVIFDADGDRVFFIDNRGRWIDPNESAYILTKLFPSPYVVGVVSSKRIKVKGAIISRVGHYFFKKLMREKKASLGLEHSGHYYFKKFFYCDSGILAAIEVINFVSALKGDLASWLDKLPRYYRSGELNFEVRDKEKVLRAVEMRYRQGAKQILSLDGLTIEFSDYWFNLRPSNTENLLRLNIESTDKNILNKELQNLKKLIIV
ncbi:MAG: phosphomannomutase/phosphoglucomutase [Candidatus Harrisonbacteria bacterium]|nr:phosphomannomutase/phosphoglucomutase [Candidatus Harrisonbacteria bacterium]